MSLLRAWQENLNQKDEVLDGEIVAPDGNGRRAFYDLMKRQCQPLYYSFDILWMNGRDRRELALLERKKILRSIIPRTSKCIGLGDATVKLLIAKGCLQRTNSKRS